MNQSRFEVVPIGRIESALTDLASAPKQGDDGSPDAWLVVDQRCSKACTASRWTIRWSCSRGSIAPVAMC